MTTPQAERMYEAQFVYKYGHLNAAVFNPLNKEVSELPTIYGFNNGGSHGWMSAVLIAQDGTLLGGHTCSSEAYMPYDLGILEGERPDRHETFQKHYPDGYKMEFVGFDDFKHHEPLKAACAIAEAAQKESA